MENPVVELHQLAEQLIKSGDTPTNRIIADMCKRIAATTEVLGLLCENVISLEGRIKRIDRKQDAILKLLAHIATVPVEDVLPPSILKDFEAEDSAKE